MSVWVLEFKGLGFRALGQEWVDVSVAGRLCNLLPLTVI